MTKRIVAAAATVALLLLTGAVVRNQGPRKVTGVVAHAPSVLSAKKAKHFLINGIVPDERSASMPRPRTGAGPTS